MPRFLSIVSVDGDTVRSYGVRAADEYTAGEIAKQQVQSLMGVISVPFPDNAIIDLDLDYDLYRHGPECDCTPCKKENWDGL